MTETIFTQAAKAPLPIVVTVLIHSIQGSTYWILLYILLLLFSADLRWDGHRGQASAVERTAPDNFHAPGHTTKNHIF